MVLQIWVLLKQLPCIAHCLLTTISCMQSSTACQHEPLLMVRHRVQGALPKVVVNQYLHLYPHWLDPTLHPSLLTTCRSISFLLSEYSLPTQPKRCQRHGQSGRDHLCSRYEDETSAMRIVEQFDFQQVYHHTQLANCR